LTNILNSATKIKIARFLLTHEAAMSEREIAGVLNVSHMSVNRTLRQLSLINFVDFVTIGKAHLWKVNRKSYAFRVLSDFIKGISGIKEPLDDLKELIIKTVPKNAIRRIILFGSVAKSEGKTDSDIDLFFLVKNEHDREKLEPALEKLSNACLETYGNRLSPYVLTWQEAGKKSRQKVLLEINKGIEIYRSGGELR